MKAKMYKVVEDWNYYFFDSKEKAIAVAEKDFAEGESYRITVFDMDTDEEVFYLQEED